MRVDRLIPLIIIIIFIVRTISKLSKGAREEEESKEDVEVYRAREEKVEKYFKTLLPGEEPREVEAEKKPHYAPIREEVTAPFQEFGFEKSKQTDFEKVKIAREKEKKRLLAMASVRKKKELLRLQQDKTRVPAVKPIIIPEEKAYSLASLLASTEEARKGIILSTILGPPKAKRWMRI